MSGISILNANMYSEIVNFIHNFNDLLIECELKLKERFKQINSQTLSGILFNECNERIKTEYTTFSAESGKFLKIFENCPMEKKTDLFIQMTKENRIPPTVMARILLFEKYKGLSKPMLTEYLKNPKLIPDRSLAQCVVTSVFLDNQEGPIADIIKRSLGEEHEIKLKEFAANAGITFSDEGDLRRTGFDKTPDIKLILPCLYKGMVVNWIESKALFGDIRTHKRNIRQQFTSYINRFGSGIVIYWFGYLEDIVNLKENSNNIIIMNQFPDKEHLEFLEY